MTSHCGWCNRGPANYHNSGVDHLNCYVLWWCSGNFKRKKTQVYIKKVPTIKLNRQKRRFTSFYSRLYYKQTTKKG